MLARHVRSPSFAPLQVHPLDPYLGLVGFFTCWVCAGSIGDDEGTSAATYDVLVDIHNRQCLLAGRAHAGGQVNDELT